MSAVGHYIEAEEFLRLGGSVEVDDPAKWDYLAIAQVHATLALAGATALQSYARVGDDDDAELDDWKAAAGGES